MFKNSFVNLSLMGDIGFSRRKLIMEDNTNLVSVIDGYEINNIYFSKSWSLISTPKALFALQFPYFSAGAEVGYRYDYFSSRWSKGFPGRDKIHGMYIAFFTGVNLHIRD